MSARLATLVCSLGLLLSLPANGRADDEGFRPLFNGKDLTGWVHVNDHPDTWSVKDGMIVTTGLPIGFLRTDRMFENFILEFEWNHQPRKDKREGNSGMFVWADPTPAKGQGYFARAIEVQVLVNLEYRDKKTGAITATSHGDLFSIWGAKCTPDRPHPLGWERSLPTENRAKGFGEWNHYRVTGKDGVIKLAVNGKEVSGVSNCKPRKGYLALEAEGNVCWFRNIKIKELPTSNPAPDEVAMDGTGWERLANLVDLTGWKSDAGQQKHWQFKDWRLTYDGKGEAKESTLASAKEYGDFELLCDWRVTGSAKKDNVPVLVRGSSMPEVKVEAPGQWNRMLLTVKGDRMSVVLNGKNTLDNQQVSGLAPKGPITLQPQGNAIEFANLYIKDLSASRVRKSP